MVHRIRRKGPMRRLPGPQTLSKAASVNASDGIALRKTYVFLATPDGKSGNTYIDKCGALDVEYAQDFWPELLGAYTNGTQSGHLEGISPSDTLKRRKVPAKQQNGEYPCNLCVINTTGGTEQRYDVGDFSLPGLEHSNGLNELAAFTNVVDKHSRSLDDSQRTAARYSRFS